MLPFVLLFLIAGSLLLAVGLQAEGDARRASRWPVTDGQLDRCEVVELRRSQVDDVSGWQLQVNYSYEVHGRRYQATRYAFGYGDGRDDRKHRAVADALRRSTPLQVHYNPAQPSEAVLSTAVQTNLTMLGCAGLAMALVAALIGCVAGW